MFVCVPVRVRVHAYVWVEMTYDRTIYVAAQSEALAPSNLPLRRLLCCGRSLMENGRTTLTNAVLGLPRIVGIRF